MKAIIALEELIQREENKIKFAKKQLSDHENGDAKLTRIVLASTEESIELNQVLLVKHKTMLSELLKQDIKELEKNEQIKEAVVRRNYFKYQKVRLKRDTVQPNDVRLEATTIVDELPEVIQIEDKELYEIAIKSLELDLTLHESILKDLDEIKDEFNSLVSNLDKENIKELELLSVRIPILVLQFHTLLRNIKENSTLKENKKFIGFPRFEDWWIAELWESHQAYFGLFKWKKIIENLCNTSDQKRAWYAIFSNWVSIKKQLNIKGKLGFEYNLAFDKLIRKYCELEEEYEIKNLQSMKKIVEALIMKADLKEVSVNHQLITPYTEFKINKTKGKN